MTGLYNVKHNERTSKSQNLHKEYNVRQTTIKQETKLLIISQISVNWRAVFLGFGSDDMEILLLIER